MIGEHEYALIFTDELLAALNNMEVLLNSSTIEEEGLTEENRKYVRVGFSAAFNMMRDIVRKVQQEASSEILKALKSPPV